MELDTTIMQTKTVRAICEVLEIVQDELVIPRNRDKVEEILSNFRDLNGGGTSGGGTSSGGSGGSSGGGSAGGSGGGY